MVFKKKVKEVIDADVADTKAKEKEIEVSPELQAKIKLFEAEYSQLFVPADFAYIRPEALQCNLLFAVWVELRRLQELVKE